MNAIDFYKMLPVQKIQLGEATFGLRQVGRGSDLVFLHGFPTHSYTWRKLLPELSKKFRCHLLDVPGLGDSNWTRKTNFGISAQAFSVVQLMDTLNIDTFNLLAHNSGGTIARVVAIDWPKRVKHLILINTEIPDHRPPFIELYQKLASVPFATYYFRFRLNQKRFIRSSGGFKQAYSNKSMLDQKENLGPYLQPLVRSNKKAKGAFKYLKGIDWEVVDAFRQTHKNIQAKVLLLWGEDDKTFPMRLAWEMADQFTSCELKIIKNASLLPHEEKPQVVLSRIANFLKAK